MVAILIAVLAAYIAGTDFVVDNMLTNLSLVSFYAEDFMSSSIITGKSLDFTSFFAIGYDFGVALIVLKFLKKGFEQYISWTDGDPDQDPLNYLTGFIKALALASAFPQIYKWMVFICYDVTKDIIAKFDVVTGTSLVDQILSATLGNLFQALGGAVMVTLFILIWLQMIGRGIEILVLRIGFPIACVGLIDNDKGVYQPYMKKFFMCVFTILVQIFLTKLAVTVMNMGNIIYGIGVAMVAIKTPKILQEFMLFATGGGSGGMYHTSQMFRMVKSALSKGGGK